LVVAMATWSALFAVAWAWPRLLFSGVSVVSPRRAQLEERLLLLLNLELLLLAPASSAAEWAEVEPLAGGFG